MNTKTSNFLQNTFLAQKIVNVRNQDASEMEKCLLHTSQLLRGTFARNTVHFIPQEKIIIIS